MGFLQIIDINDTLSILENVYSEAVSKTDKEFWGDSSNKLSWLIPMLDKLFPNEVTLLHGKTDIFKKPVIGAVNVDCIGGGLELLLPTDIRVASPNARFGLPEVKWSIYPFGGATIKLIQQIGYVHAMDLLLTGRLISAEEARKIGLVNDIEKTGSVLDWALEKAHMIAANSPSAVQAVKTQISSSIAEHVRSREDLDQKLGDQVRADPNFKEGVNAFLEKRQPKY